jgi:hypothetical protein
VVCGAGGHDPHRQRQPRAHREQVGDRLGLGRESFMPEVAGQQLSGVGLGQDVEVEQVSAVQGGQTGKTMAAGDQNRAGGAARQQRTYLVGVAGVVQHDQHLLVGHQAAIARGLDVQFDRQRGRINAERDQEGAERLTGGGGMSGRVEPAQVDM